MGAYLYLHRTTIYPGLYVNATPVGGLTPQAALAELHNNNSIDPLPTFTITVVNERDPEHKIASSSAELGLHYNYEEAVAFAYAYGRTGTTWQKLQAIFHAPAKSPQLTAALTFDPSAVEKLSASFAQLVDDPGTEPSITLERSGVSSSLVVEPGIAGQKVDQEALSAAIASTAPQATAKTIPVSPLPAVQTLSEAAQEKLILRAEKLVGKTITATAEDYTFSLKDQELVSYLGIPDDFNQEKMAETIATWAEQVDRPAQDAVFEYDPQTLKVTAFQPDKPGLKLDQETTLDQLHTQVVQLEANPEAPLSSLELAPVLSQAQTTLATTNNLGISERIGWGESTYHHSIPNRVHNVEITANRINNVIVPPGTEFSFNTALGDVSAQTGYRTAYVIKNGRTELGDGGGVCQVSTTLFRALLNSGLPITRRLPHSYRVGYYEQNSEPGYDATVYAGNVDLRFKNDTGQHVLIHMEVNSQTQYLKTELYGTGDGRTTEIVNYRKWGASAPPPAEYIPDPSLAPGQQKQIDWAVGGLNTQFTHRVMSKSGDLISEKTYTSIYRPWSAKYLVGQ